MADKITRPDEPYKTGSLLLFEHMRDHGQKVEFIEDSAPQQGASALTYAPHTPLYTATSEQVA